MIGRLPGGLEIRWLPRSEDMSSDSIRGRLSNWAMRRFWKNNSLSIVLFGLFFVVMVGQSVTGFQTYNDERSDHGQLKIGYDEYLTSGHFGEAIFENWESEFLQMSFFILLTVYFRQKGSAESKKVGGPEDVDNDPLDSRRTKDVPWPVRKGGIVLRIYEHSLSLAFILLFTASLALHAVEGARAYNGERIEHGDTPVSVVAYTRSSQFWFESLQNWQSEFLAVGCMVLFSVYLRERGSPESKPVDMPHHEMA